METQRWSRVGTRVDTLQLRWWRYPRISLLRVTTIIKTTDQSSGVRMRPFVRRRSGKRNAMFEHKRRARPWTNEVMFQTHDWKSTTVARGYEENILVQSWYELYTQGEAHKGNKRMLRLACDCTLRCNPSWPILLSECIWSIRERQIMLCHQMRRVTMQGRCRCIEDCVTEVCSQCMEMERCWEKGKRWMRGLRSDKRAKRPAQAWNSMTGQRGTSQWELRDIGERKPKGALTQDRLRDILRLMRTEDRKEGRKQNKRIEGGE